MGRGPKKHLKRLNAPRHWMLAKMGGIYAPRPSQGPHKMRECLPLVLVLRNRLKYALTRREVIMVAMRRLVKVDGKVRSDPNYPTGFMDVISIDKTGELFRLLYDVKGRFVLHKIVDKEAGFKLCRVLQKSTANKGTIGRNPFSEGQLSAIPYVVTHDGRTIRYPDPLIHINDSVKVDLSTGKIVDFVKFDVGNMVMITRGANIGRVGVIAGQEKHPGSHTIVHIKDRNDHAFATRAENVFVIGKGTQTLISLPKDKGLKLSIIDQKAAAAKRAEKPAKKGKATKA